MKKFSHLKINKFGKYCRFKNLPPRLPRPRVLHLSKAETFLGWQCVPVTLCAVQFWCMTVWHKVIKKTSRTTLLKDQILYKIMGRDKLLRNPESSIVCLPCRTGRFIFLWIPRAWTLACCGTIVATWRNIYFYFEIKGDRNCLQLMRN